MVGFSETFEIAPSVINQEGQFVISVKNNKKLDYEQIRQINFKIVTTELGINKLTDTADITVNLVDKNDNKPVFARDVYEVDMLENQQPGTKVDKVRLSMDNALES